MRWDIDRDVIRGRTFDLAHTFLPDGLSLADELPSWTPAEQRFMSQVQGRTYANMFGLVERFIGAKMLEVSRDHWLGDQVALEAIVRFTDEELKHQALFRRIEQLDGQRHAGGLPVRRRAQRRGGVRAGQEHLGRAGADLPHRAVLAGALPRQHRRGARAVAAVQGCVPVPLAEESQHAIIDELEWEREDAKLAIRGAARRGGGRPDRAGRRRRRHPAGPGRGDAAYFLAASGMEPDGTRASRCMPRC
jgi:hypothetical protein